MCKKYLKVGSIPVVFLSATSILKDLVKALTWYVGDKQVSFPLPPHKGGVLFYFVFPSKK